MSADRSWVRASFHGSLLFRRSRLIPQHLFLLHLIAAYSHGLQSEKEFYYTCATKSNSASRRFVKERPQEEIMGYPEDISNRTFSPGDRAKSILRTRCVGACSARPRYFGEHKAQKIGTHTRLHKKCSQRYRRGQRFS